MSGPAEDVRTPSLRKRVAAAVDGYLRAVLANRRERRRVWRGDIADRILAFYGYDRIPGRGDFAQGGIVKCQDLVERFPNQPQGANLLYLVSSALPPGAVAMARRARNQGAPVVLNQNGVAYPAWHGRGWERTNAPMRALLALADYVFYQSEFCRQSANRFAYKREHDWEIAYNPIDTRRFVPGERRRAECFPQLLVSGSHMQFYRVESAVRAFAHVRTRLPRASLTVAGHLGWRPREADAEAELRSLCAACSVSDCVTLAGRYTQRDAVGLLQNADILLHTKYNDPCPRMVVEAMACGVPVVYSATGGTPELVGQEAGVGIAVAGDWHSLGVPDPEALAEGVLRVVAEFARYHAAARQRAVARFDVNPWLDRHETVFRALLGGRRPLSKGDA